MSGNNIPTYVSPEEAEDLCITPGWYIADGEYISLGKDMAVPFETEEQAIESIERYPGV